MGFKTKALVSEMVTGQGQLRDVSRGTRAIDSSYVKLQWNIRGVFDKIWLLKEELERILSSVPEENLKESEKNRKARKIRRWIEQLSRIQSNVEYIKTVKMAEVEKSLNYLFSTPDLFVLSLVQPSFKNIFNDLKTSSLDSEIKSVTANDFEEFQHMDEAAKVLALIGDAVIDIALVQILWVPNISNVGSLTKGRSEIASNKNLARLCDKLGLYDCRIHQDPPAPDIKDETVNHTKGTIVEAIFGVMYLEQGLEQVFLSSLALK